MTKKKKSDLEVIRNHDYTITLRDSVGKELHFRDICGADLEYLDSIFSSEEDGSPNPLTYDDVIKILERVALSPLDFKDLPQRISIRIFEKIREHILLNYMPKYAWLRRCYAIQNGSFSGVTEMERVPMTKFVAMSQIHQDAIDSIGKET
jgi:hypothetical protein